MDFAVSVFDLTPALIDSNQKVVLDGAVAELAGEGDEFGNAFDAVHWLVFGAPWTENGGIIKCNDGGVGIWDSYLARDFEYLSADCVADYQDTKAAVKAYLAHVGLQLSRRAGGNFVWIQYRSRLTAGNQKIYAYKSINGAQAQVAVSGNVGSVAHVKFRIRRRASDNTFWFYYDIGAGWVLLWSGIIYDATHFNYTHVVWPIAYVGCQATADLFEPEVDYYEQTIAAIAYQRFWDDSPEIYIIDNALVEWAFDATEGKTFRFASASDNAILDVKYKVGYSDTGLLADTTWVDGAWQTIAQVSTNAGNGDYDGHRYIHVKAQFNSDSTTQPTLTDLTFSGSTISDIAPTRLAYIRMRIGSVG